jgi:hypothetical protein
MLALAPVLALSTVLTLVPVLSLALVQFFCKQHAPEPLPDPIIQQLHKGHSSLAEVAEFAYSSYSNLMQKEQEAELVITLPPKPAKSGAAAGAGGGEACTPAAAAGLQSAAAGAAAAAGQSASQGGSVHDGRGTTPGEVNTPAAAAGSAAAGNTAAGSTAGGSTAAATSSAPAPATSTGSQPPPPAASTPGDRAAGGTPGDKSAAAAAQETVTISVTFHKPGGLGSFLLREGGFLVAAKQLRRCRAWFPCVDAPVYSYVQNGPYYVACTWELHVTVNPNDVAVCSGVLTQQTLGMEGILKSPRPEDKPQARYKTFHYEITTPTVPSNICIAIGPFTILPGTELFGKGYQMAGPSGNSAVLTVFSPGEVKSSGSSTAAGKGEGNTTSGAAGATGAASNGTNAAVGGGGGVAGGTSGVSAAAAVADGEVGGSGSSSQQGFRCSRDQLFATLRPLPILLKLYDNKLQCKMPFSHLQVAVVPAMCLLQPVQVRWAKGLLFRVRLRQPVQV